VVDVSAPGAPGANEALLGIEIATLNKHDLLFMATLWGAVRPSRLSWAIKGGRIYLPRITQAVALGRNVFGFYSASSAHSNPSASDSMSFFGLGNSITTEVISVPSARSTLAL
jgi:hypothetical protein